MVTLKIVKLGDVFRVLLHDDSKGIQCKYMSLSKERAMAYCFGYSDASEHFVNVIDSSDESYEESIFSYAVDDLPD